jgi:peroxiredoxin
VCIGVQRRTLYAQAMTSPVPAVGSEAPDFTLPSTDGSVTLSQFRGQKDVLLAFFPLAFTSTCTQELCDMRDEWDLFEDTGTVVLPISVDSVDTLKEYKWKYDFKSQFLSDFKREVSRQYGVLLEDRFYSNRAYFLIDKAGILRWVHVEEHPGKKRTNAELLAQLQIQ